MGNRGRPRSNDFKNIFIGHKYTDHFRIRDRHGNEVREYFDGREFLVAVSLTNAESVPLDFLTIIRNEDNRQIPAIYKRDVFAIEFHSPLPSDNCYICGRKIFLTPTLLNGDEFDYSADNYKFLADLDHKMAKRRHELRCLRQLMISDIPPRSKTVSRRSRLRDIDYDQADGGPTEENIPLLGINERKPASSGKTLNANF